MAASNPCYIRVAARNNGKNGKREGFAAFDVGQSNMSLSSTLFLIATI